MQDELKIGTIISLLTIIIGIIIQIIYTPLYMNFLGTVDFGINSLVQTITSYISLLNLGLGNTIIRYTLFYREQKKFEEEKKINGLFLIIFLLIMLASIILGIIIYFKIPLFFGEKFSSEELQRTQKVFFIMMISTSISFPISVFSANIFSKEKYIYHKITSLFKVLITPILGFILMKLGYKLIAIVIMTTTLNIIIGILDIGYALKLGMRFIFKDYKLEVLKDIFKHSIFIFLGLIMTKVYWGVDRILVGKYLGTEALGIYSIASIFLSIYMSFSGNINSLIFPKINKFILEDKKEELSNFILIIGRFQYMLLGLVASGFFIFGEEFINLWLGKKFELVYKLILWIIFPVIIPLVQNSYTLILQVKNKHQIITIFYFILAIINIFGSIIGIKKYGIFGCVIITAISLIVGHILILGRYFYKNIDKNIVRLWLEILKLTLPIILIVIIGKNLNKFFYVNNFKILSLKILIYCLLYLGCIYFGGMNIREKNEVKKILKVLTILR